MNRIIGFALLPPIRTFPSGEKYTMITVITQASVVRLNAHAKLPSIQFVTVLSPAIKASPFVRLTTTIATSNSQGGKNTPFLNDSFTVFSCTSVSILLLLSRHYIYKFTFVSSSDSFYRLILVFRQYPPGNRNNFSVQPNDQYMLGTKKLKFSAG